MPTIDVHSTTSATRTGKEYRAVHEFVDTPGRKDERHDIKKIHEFGEMFRKSNGEEAVREYIQHIHDDVRGKFGHLIEDLEKSVKEITASLPSSPGRDDLSRKLSGLVRETERAVKETLAYFGVSAKPLQYSIRDDDLAVLRKAGVAEKDVGHSLKVAQKALDIARRTEASVDMEFVGRAALFHDLGKAQTHAIEHGRLGAEAGKKLGLPESINAVMEKHIRGGLTKAEARELGLPKKITRSAPSRNGSSSTPIGWWTSSPTAWSKPSPRRRSVSRKYCPRTSDTVRTKQPYRGISATTARSKA